MDPEVENSAELELNCRVCPTHRCRPAAHDGHTSLSVWSSAVPAAGALAGPLSRAPGSRACKADPHLLLLTHALSALQLFQRGNSTFPNADDLLPLAQSIFHLQRLLLFSLSRARPWDHLATVHRPPSAAAIAQLQAAMPELVIFYNEWGCTFEQPLSSTISSSRALAMLTRRDRV